VDHTHVHHDELPPRARGRPVQGNAGDDATSRPARAVTPNPAIAWRMGDPDRPVLAAFGSWAASRDRAGGPKAAKTREGSRRDVVTQGIPPKERASRRAGHAQPSQVTWTSSTSAAAALPVARRAHNCSCRRCGTSFWKTTRGYCCGLQEAALSGAAVCQSSEHCVFFRFGLGDVFSGFISRLCSRSPVGSVSEGRRRLRSRFARKDEAPREEARRGRAGKTAKCQLQFCIPALHEVADTTP